MIEISVIICTCNRSNDLKDILDCLLNQKFEANWDYEVIIADNNSRDNTREVVESYMSKFKGNLRYLFEHRQGKPFALNFAIKEAKGRILAFTDDDCLLEESYLMSIYKIFREYDNDVGILGGKIFPRWINCSPPAWLNEIFAQPPESKDGKPNFNKITLQGVLGILDYGNKPFIIDCNQKNHNFHEFYGANLAIKKNVLNEYGYFNLKKTRSQDSEICLRLFKAGVKGIYAPNVIVYHKIRNSNITPRYYYKWCFNDGKNSELRENFQRKFYHPFGIQLDFILKTINIFKRSFFVEEPFRKIVYRCELFFNLGQMVKLFKENII